MSKAGPFDCPHGNGAYIGVGSKCPICYLEAENAALREVIAEISSAAINPALDIPDKLDLVQSVLIDWHKGKAADAAKEQA